MAVQTTMRPLGQVLADLGGEIALARDLAQRLELLLQTLGVHADPEQMIECQAVDLLAQRLGGLAHYLGVLAIDAGPARVDVGPALEALPLRDQALRLGGERMEACADKALIFFED